MTGEDKQPWKWGVLTVVLLAVFILVVDTTMMNVAINELATDLDTTVNTIQGIIAVYALVMAAFMLFGSKLGDILGRKKAFLIGVGIYGVGTFIAAISWNATVLLIGWALLEGFAAAMMLPSTTTFLTNSYRGKDKAMAFALWGGIAAAGAAFGPIIGGYLTTYHTWRYGFMMELGIVVVVLGLAFLLTETKASMKWKQLDKLGVVLTVVSLGMIVVSILMAQTYGLIEPKQPLMVGDTQVAPFGLSPVLFILCGGIILFYLFIKWEWRRVKRDEIPLLDPSVFKNLAFNIGITEAVIQNLVLAGLLFIFPVYLGSRFDMEAIDIGLFLMPMSLAVLFVSLGATTLSKWIKPVILLALGFAISMLGTWFMRDDFTATTEYRDLIPGTIIIGIGVGLILSQLTHLTMATVRPDQDADASGMYNTTRQLGTSLGTAFVGAILFIAAFYAIVDGIAETDVGDEFTKDEIAEAVYDFMNKMQNGEIDPEDINLTDEEQMILKGIAANATDTGMASAMDVLSITLGFGLVVLLVGMAVLNRRKRREDAEETEDLIDIEVEEDGVIDRFAHYMEEEEIGSRIRKK